MMSNKEFLELLNLYIDQEISPEDRELLEREIGSNESRLAMFNEYVRLQQATEKLFNHFRDNLSETVDLKKYQILSRNSQQRLVLGSLYSAAAVLVACMSIFAATRILSDPMGVPHAQALDAEAALDRIDVEVLAEGGLQRSARGFFSGTAAGNALPSTMNWAFADFADFTESFGIGLEREAFNRNGNRVFQSTSPFESPSPDHVSFQFQR